MTARLILALSVFSFCLACGGGSTPTTPTSTAINFPPVTVSACQANNTALVSFQNRSTTVTLDVIWDGAKTFTLTPNQTSAGSTVAAGVQHTLRFQVTNTLVVFCAQGTPTLARCESQTYVCPA